MTDLFLTPQNPPMIVNPIFDLIERWLRSRLGAESIETLTVSDRADIGVSRGEVLWWRAHADALWLEPADWLDD